MYKSNLLTTVIRIFALSLLAAGTSMAGPGGGSPGDGISVSRADGTAALTITDSLRDNGTPIYTLFGAATDTVVFGDWNGDGTKTIGVFRNDNGAGLWIRDFTGSGSLTYDLFGNGTDTPVVGDWDPNATGDEIGVVRTEGTALRWILRDNSTNACACSDTSFGASTDLPVPGNWDGDANNGWEKGVTRADGTAMLWITEGSGGLDYALFGDDTGLRFPGDWDGDGNTDVGTRPSDGDGNVFILEGTPLEYLGFGLPSDSPTNSGNFGQ